MKKMIFLTLSSFVFFVFQAGAQEKTATQTRATDKASVAPVKTTVTTQTGDIQNVSTSNRAPVNSNVTTKTCTPAMKNPVNNVSVSKKQDVSDFPTYINTGDQEKDMETYAKAKQEWISKNPEKYQQMLNPTK